MENDDKKKDEGQTQTPETSPQDGSEVTPEATGKTINISGKSFNVSDEVAQAFSGFTQGVDRRFDERSQELGGLRQFKNDTLQREEEVKDAANKQGQPDLSTLMYEDPNKFVEILDQKAEKRIEDLKDEYKKERATEKEEVVFWDSIWEENKDLALVKRQSADVLRMVGQKYAHMKLPNTKEVRDAYAKETREWMKGIMGTNNNGDPNSFVEGASPTTPAKTKKTEDKPRRTTKEILESRREKKRKAMAERT